MLIKLKFYVLILHMQIQIYIYTNIEIQHIEIIKEIEKKTMIEM